MTRGYGLSLLSALLLGLYLTYLLDRAVEADRQAQFAKGPQVLEALLTRPAARLAQTYQLPLDPHITGIVCVGYGQCIDVDEARALIEAQVAMRARMAGR